MKQSSNCEKNSRPNTAVSFPTQFPAMKRYERKSMDETTIHSNSGSCTTDTSLTRGRTRDMQQDKIKGRQMMNFLHDHATAKEKRTRQMKYSLELKDSSKSYTSLQINSIMRIIVRRFKDLVACERCSLFIMDHKTNELYFKPVGNHEEDNSDPVEIRFPASMGVAGYVATHKKSLNIRNVRQDKRFNSEIDIQTDLRTRTILCAPVMSSKGRLIGVIQMVNKMKRCDQKKTNNIARRRKTDEFNHGYASYFETFSPEDEQTIDRCCVEVAKALEPILFPRDFNNGEHAHSLKHTVERLAAGRRRSSLVNLFQFVNDITKPQEETDGPITFSGKAVSVSEAFSRFQFRSTSGPQMTSSGTGSQDHQLAVSRRKRMNDYNRKRRQSVMKPKDAKL